MVSSKPVHNFYVLAQRGSSNYDNVGWGRLDGLGNMIDVVHSDCDSEHSFDSVCACVRYVKIFVKAEYCCDG